MGKCYRARPIRQRGVALIVVLMLLAIMATIAATMSERLFTQFKRAGNQLNYQQAYWYSLGIEGLAKVGIEQSYEDNETINLNQPWALEEQVFPLDYGQVSGRIKDKQACFNLNVLSQVTAESNSSNSPYLVAVWQRLLEELEVEPYQAEVIAESSWEFIDGNTETGTSSGVEDSTYEAMKPAYLTANSLLADSSELRAIYQVSGEVMQKVSPYICALPTDDWRLNVNTLTPEQSMILVAMFSPNLSASNAKDLIENRPFDGWASVDEFMAEAAMVAIEESVSKKAKPYLTVDSAYFELDAEVLVDKSRVRIRSLFYSDNRETVTVVRRRFGGISERVSDRSTE
ncbi:general secretion pathway protein GspK [Vibrio sp. T187]|uniref:type II secretion system minor pseudopilin GspK n=1 Tax=Vibrio TaxID=662 RepID=UPI0010C9D61F|nr:MULTISPECIES: type II secretion system minor pseudopilin GspK [Vibrio]MBW3697643.1 general secretion pathway protein GspK [Vibrio sp. T187]